MRLSPANARALPDDVARPSYDRDAQDIGIVHFGIGAFHRAHQAWYTDRAMDAGDRHWAMTGVSLRSAHVATQLNPQGGLYTVTQTSAQGRATRLIGAVRDVLVGTHDRSAIIARLSASTTHIVSFTVTEKGYCRAADGTLDPELAGPESFYSILAAALRQRHDAGRAGLTLLSCDNLAENGQQLARLMEAYLNQHDAAMLGWFRAECACPSSMVDRIVPAMTDAGRKEIATQIGMEDVAAVVTEPFSQWIIEDQFVGPRPRWEAVGAQLVGDVRPYETAKLRMLNGAHSLLAYCGLARKFKFVHEAIGDPELRALAEQLMREEAAPTISASPGQDLEAYAQELIARFANPALNHSLVQIAMDGSQKIPQRWLETLADNTKRGKACPAIDRALDAWVWHLRGNNGPVDDPMAAKLSALLENTDNPRQTLIKNLQGLAARES